MRKEGKGFEARRTAGEGGQSEPTAKSRQILQKETKKDMMETKMEMSGPSFSSELHWTAASRSGGGGGGGGSSTLALPLSAALAFARLAFVTTWSTA